MPFVRLSIPQDKSADFVRAVADGVHCALVETFEVPPADRFQVIHRHAADELIFDPCYLDVARSNGCMLVHITAGRPRSVATKQAMYKRVVDILEKNPGVRREDVMIVISMNQLEDWSFGNGQAQLVEGN